MKRSAWVVAFVAAAVMSTAVAQQPVTSPVYYLSSAPRLDPSQPVTGELTAQSGRNFKDGTYLDVLTLRGEAGQYVEIVASSLAFDSYLTLFAPDGRMLDSNDDDPLGVTTDAAIRTTLPETGTYVVVVSGFGPWDLGPYTVTLATGDGPGRGGSDVTVPSLTQARLAPDATAARFRFTVDAVTAVAISARSDAFDTTLELFDSDGWSLAYNDDAPSDDAYTTDSTLVALLAPGTYHVVVQPYYLDWIGDGGFELEVMPLQPAP